MIFAALAAAAWVAGAADDPRAAKPAPSPFMQTVKKRALGCPVGTHAVEGAGPLRCVMDHPDDSAGAQAPAPSRAVELAPARYESARTADFVVDVPSGWHRTDAWSDEVPTLSIEHDARGGGRPVTLMIERMAPGQPDYAAMGQAIAAEKEARGAREAPRRRVDGRPARETFVAGESRSVYVGAGDGVYYVFSYSASDGEFKAYERVFARLLSSARFIK